MTFEQLAIGEMFKFFETGSLLTKTGNRRYAAPQWGQHDLPADDINQKVYLFSPAGLPQEQSDED